MPAVAKAIGRSERLANQPLCESQIEQHLVQRVEALGGVIRKVRWVGRSKAPDRRVMLLRPGFPCWVELKNPHTIRTFPADARERAQAREHKRMRDRGEIVHVIGTIEQVEALLA